YFAAEEKAEEKVNKATKRLHRAQKLYADKYNMKIVDTKSDDELEVKMQRLIAVKRYWQSVFLDYFRVSRQYDKMWDELAQQKPNSIERERLQVIKLIDEVLPVIRTRPGFNGDHEFRDQTVGILEYYEAVASRDFRRIVEILSQKSLEQKDIDEVNSI